MFAIYSLYATSVQLCLGDSRQMRSTLWLGFSVGNGQAVILSENARVVCKVWVWPPPRWRFVGKKWRHGALQSTLSSRYWLKAKLTEQPQDSAIPLLGVCGKEFEDSNDAVIQLNQRAEETPGVHQAHFYIQSSSWGSSNRWLDTVLTCYNMGELWR